MPPPATFLVHLPFKHRSPEFVRGVAQSFAFALQTTQGTRESEIWSKPDGDRGYWLIRLDIMGHGTGKVLPPKPLKPGEKPRPNYFYSERPHYHKNWVESQWLLEKYCETYVPQAWIYVDSGEVLCQAGDAATLHPDKKARLQHILR